MQGRVRLVFDQPFRTRTSTARALTGTLTGSTTPLRVRVALSRRWKGSKSRCSWWVPKRVRFGSPTSCSAPVLFTAKVTRTGRSAFRWRAPLGGPLRSGVYGVLVRAFGPDGQEVPAVVRSRG